MLRFAVRVPPRLPATAGVRPASLAGAWRRPASLPRAFLQPAVRQASTRSPTLFRPRHWDHKSVLYALVGANVGVFVLWHTLGKTHNGVVFMMRNWTLSRSSLVWRPWTVVTHMFSQADVMHMAVNCMGLYFFGGSLLAATNPVAFLTLYGAGGLASAAAHLLSSNSNVMGASGAVNAVVMASIVLFPRQTVLLYMFIPMPATLLGLGLVAMDVVGAWRQYQGRSTSTVAHAAHLGGAAVGILAGVAFRRGLRL